MRIVRLTIADLLSIRHFVRQNTTGIIYLYRDTVEELQKLLTDNSFFAYGVYEENKQVGYFARRIIDKNTQYLHDIVVHKNYRGKGYGGKIIDSIIAQIKPGQDKYLELVTSPKNLSALFLYLKKGFIIYDFKKDFLGSGQDRLFLRKKLEITPPV